MDIEQTTELSFTKINEIDTKVNEILDVVTDSNPESSTTLKELTNEIKTNTELIEEKVNSVIDALNNGAELDTSELENKISQTTTSIENLSADLTNIADDITSINSSTSTIRTNITSMVTDVDKIYESTTSTKEDHKYIKGKLNEILRRLGTTDEEFTEDPFKLNLDYAGKLTENRNTTNYDFIEINKTLPFDNYINATLAHTTGTTYSFKASITFTTESSVQYIYCREKNKNYSQRFYAGTHTHVFEGNDLTVTNGEIVLTFYGGNENFTLHNFKLEIFADNVVILNKAKNKYFVHTTPEKICISKVKDNNGYCLELNKEHLNPALLNQEYTLGQSNVSNYQFTYSFSSYLNTIKDMVKIETYTNLDNYSYTRYDNNYSNRRFTNTPTISTDLGYFAGNSVTQNLIYITSNTNVQFGSTRVNPNSSYNLTNHTSILPNKVCATCNVLCTNIFDGNDKQAFVLTDFAGNNYLYVKSTALLYNIGYGINTTAFFDKTNPLQVNVYLNDNGNCVQHKILLSEDKTTATPIISKIIGTYDSYFETDSNIYFVEKDDSLYMYKNL